MKPIRPLNISLSLLFLFLSAIISSTEGDRHSNRLLKDLLTHYNIYERPILNASERVVVNFGVALHQLVGLDERSQTIETIMFFKFQWIDVNLDWSPSEYGGIQELRMPINKIWKPDVLLYNSADTPWDRTYPVTAVVRHNGTVLWLPPSYVKSSCKVDVTWFPFDEQMCHFKFVTWSHDYSKIDLMNESDAVDRSHYMQSSDWSLIHTEVVRSVNQYTCCPNPFVDVTVNIYLRRRTLSYGANLIVPTLITSLMAILVFALPSESGEKISLDLTVLLSLLFCLNMLADRSPPTSEAVPLLGIFFLCCTILVALSIVMSVIVLNHHHSDPDTAAMTDLEKLFYLTWLPKLVGVSRPPIDSPSTRKKSKRQQPKPKSKTNAKFHKVLKCEECEEDLLPPCTCGGLIEMRQRSPSQPQPIPPGQNREFDFDYEGEEQEEEDDDEPPPPYASIFRRQKASLREIQNRLRRQLSEKQSTSSLPPTGTDFNNRVLSKMAERIDVPLGKVAGFIKKTKNDDAMKNDWQFAARAIDRLCLYLFFGLIVTITGAFCFSAPHIVA